MTTPTTTPEQDARRRRTLAWVVSLAFVGLLFDGYDLVVYGAVLSTFLRDPGQIGPVTPALGGVQMPESPTWLLSRGRVDEARAVSERTGVPLDEAPPVPAVDGHRERVGYAGLFSGGNALPAILLGFMSVTGLVLVYALNTGLPELMKRAGFSTQGSLAFLLVLNGGAVVGALAGSRVADRFGPEHVVAGSFLIGALAIAVVTFSLPIGVLLFFIAVVGLGTSGTQTLLFGFVANYFGTNVRGAAVAWCAGFGRLGGVGGPLLGGLLIGAGLALNSIFYVLAAVALLGTALTLLVPPRRVPDRRPAPVPLRH